MNLDVVISVVLGMFLYNVLFRALGSVIIREFMKSDTAKEKKSEFREKLKEKLERD